MSLGHTVNTNNSKQYLMPFVTTDAYRDIIVKKINYHYEHHSAESKHGTNEPYLKQKV